MRVSSHHLVYLALWVLAGCSAGIEAEPTPLPLFTLNSIWAADADDIWLAGALPAPTHGSGLVHYDGVSWSLLDRFDGQIAQVSGSGPDDVWLLERRSSGWESYEHRWYRGSSTGFEEHPLPTSEADTYRFLGGARDDVWLVTSTEDAGDSGWVGELRIWRHDGATWTEVAGAPGARLRSWFEVVRDGDGQIWIAGEARRSEGLLPLQRWSAERGWVSVALPPEVDQQPSVQVEGGRLHMVSGSVYRYGESGWTVISEPPGEEVRSSRGHTVTAYGIWSVEHSRSRTSCRSLSECGDTETDLSEGTARLDRAGQEDFVVPVQGSCGDGPCFVQESPDEAWMITARRAWRLEPR